MPLEAMQQQELTLSRPYVAKQQDEAKVHAEMRCFNKVAWPSTQPRGVGRRQQRTTP